MSHTKTFCKKLLCLLICLASVFSLSACGEANVSQIQLFSMDTVMTLTAYGSKREAGLKAASAVISALDTACNPQLATSSVYQINNANGERVVVTGQIADMLSTAQTVYERSEGAYDLTLYPVLLRWGFVDGRYYVPSDIEIASDLELLCFDQMTLTSFNTSGTFAVALPSYGKISLASCAKGCASKYAIDAMRSAGVSSGIVSLGGSVQTLGLKPDGTSWQVGVTDPNNTATYLGILEVGETAVVTSGSYQRFFTSSSGKSYHHIINPASGYPTSNGLVSVTVVCEDGTLADCLSTALFVMGASKALKYWRTYGGFDMILISSDNTIIVTSGLMERFSLTNDSYTYSYAE